MTVYKDKKSPYYYFDFRRGGQRFCGSTKRTDRVEADTIEQAEIERAEREQGVARKAATSPEMIALLPRHVVRESCKTGWKYSFIVPKKARRAGCAMHNEALGTEYEAAVARAETVLLPALDAWWTDYMAASRLPVATVKPDADQKASAPQIGVYLLMLKGKVVYVGSSLRMSRRVADHRQHSRPFDEVFYIATERSQRLRLEATLIKSLDPIQNKQGRRRGSEIPDKSLESLQHPN